MAKQTRADRIRHANELIAQIAAHGRRFFHYARENRTARFELTESGRVRFRDECTDLLVDTSRKTRWNPGKFSGGGTMQRLVAALGDYVAKGVKVDRRHFGPWSPMLCDGDLWGYGPDEMATLRNAIRDSDCLAPQGEGPAQ
jgi:hypothetical protein